MIESAALGLGRVGRGPVLLAVAATALFTGAVAVAGEKGGTPAHPGWESNPQASAPVVSTHAGIREVLTVEPAFRLVPDSTPPRRGAVELLWFQGRATQPAGPHRVVLTEQGEVLAISDRLSVERAILDGLGTRTPSAVAGGVRGTLWLAVADGLVLQLDPDGRVLRETMTPFAHPTLASSRESGSLVVARAADRFEFLLDTGPAPLFGMLDPEGRLERASGVAGIPEHVLLRELANAGHMAMAGSRVFYAPFIRDELVALSPEGDTLWLARRALPQHTVEPRFEIVEGQAVINYHPVNLGVAVGPDGMVYLLSTPGFTTMAARLDVFDPESGVMLRSVQLEDPLPTIAVDGNGRVHLLDPVTLLTGSAPAQRPPGPDVELPLLGGGQVALSNSRGQVTLVNLWASWCKPCRQEMPALDALRRRLAGPEFVFLAINEDLDVSDAVSFLEQSGSDFAVPLGKGRMGRVFHYPGLPFTVLLDRDGRVVRTWIGYAGDDQIAEIESVTRAEMTRSRNPIPAGTSHSH